MLVVLAVLSLQFQSVQTYVSKKVATYLSNELNSDITIDYVYFKPFSSITIKGFNIKDSYGVPLIAVDELSANISLTQVFNNKIVVEELNLKEGFINIELYKDSSNFSSIVNYFSPKKGTKPQKKKQIDFQLDKATFVNNHFKLRNHNFKGHNKGIDFANLDITDFSAVFDKIKIDSVIAANISGFTLRERSGLFIQQLDASATYGSKKMEFKNLFLKTNRSLVQDYVCFEYDKISDFSQFITDVKITGNLKNASVDSKDIEYFAPTMRYVVFKTNVHRASLKGTVANIDARNVHLSTGKNTELKGNLSIKGLPDIDKTLFKVELAKLQTSPKDVELLVSQLANKKEFTLPEQIQQFQKTTFEGRFDGFYNDFWVDGNFNTAVGDVTMKSNIDLKKELKYKGQLSSKQLDVGALLAINTIGNTGLELDFEGQGLSMEELLLQFSGKLSNSKLLDYSYNQISVNATLKDKTLEINGEVADDNLTIDYQSTLDWKQESPSYLLDAEIHHANLNKLGFINKDSVEIHAAHINTNLIGNSLNTLTGHLDAAAIQLSTTKGNFNIKSLQFKADGTESNRSLRLNSDILDAKMEGIIDLNTIIPYFKSLAMRYAPAIGIDIHPYNPQDFNLDVHVKSFTPIAALLDPSLSLDDGAHLSAIFSSEQYTAQFVAFSPLVLYKGIKLTNLSIQENADNKAFSLDVQADRMSLGDSTYINNIAIRNVLANDSLLFNVRMSEKNAINYLDLNGNIHFAHNAPAYIKFKPSSIIINKESWQLNDDAAMRVSKGKFYIANLILSQAQQRIKLDGILSNENDKINVQFDKFSLTSLQGITSPLGIELSGFLSGEVEITSLFKTPFASSNITTTPIIYNGLPIGQLNLKADFDPNIGTANVDLALMDERNRGVNLQGTYNFYNDNEPLNLSGKLNETDLMLFQPFLKNLVSDLQGKATADINIKGTFKNPKITGVGRFSNSQFVVNYLKTRYYVDNQMAMVENNAIMLQNLQIRDSKNQVATANGIINLSKLASPYIDVDVNGTNFMILNTTYKDNNQYYGTAHATGAFRFKGYTSAIDIDINAKSEKGTVLTIPFNSAMTVSDSDFIYFISKDSTENEKQQRRSLFKGITMNMNLSLTADAEINLQTNPGSLKGNGLGEIAMKITSLGDFEMFGDYTVNTGKFHFTAQDFINKYFDIKEGGTIRWTGNPSEANINLTAIYQQRTAVGPLYNAAGRTGDDERVLAQADMLIKGTLEQPDITFDLNFPQNPYIKDQLQSYLSDINNVNQQALSLIVRRSFTPNSTSEIGKEVNSTLLSAGTEIAFNQLNNIISQSLNVNFFDLNIRSFNDASASVRLLNDRLILTGGITDRTNYQANDLTFFREGITTDAELTYRLRKDGNLILRAYNRPYTRNFLIRMNEGEYISAFGVVYRQEFDTFQEFWKKMWTWGYRKEQKPKEETKKTSK
ncbi:translocation/assembly module TamB domain-containing protein [Sphingobacterium yanglingense]|uniref:Autotransporter translocation and assembly factor TamB n=1 Tax=Sphingobacterium yanglingense TaxID=1437280 RepID=A0A4R6WNY9_9SPHI|nr:translocation/assembly module TamB domain-containing protein [Sphingobacterium yanglingense]TDQ82795.1 autotransporter translocation and assembly factor TamB [Sphingobacterium yanglingense]